MPRATGFNYSGELGATRIALDCIGRREKLKSGMAISTDSIFIAMVWMEEGKGMIWIGNMIAIDKKYKCSPKS